MSLQASQRDEVYNPSRVAAETFAVMEIVYQRRPSPTGIEALGTANCAENWIPLQEF